MPDWVVAWTIVTELASPKVTPEVAEELRRLLANAGAWVVEHDGGLTVGLWVNGWHRPTSSFGAADDAIRFAAHRAGLHAFEIQSVMAIPHDLRQTT